MSSQHNQSDNNHAEYIETSLQEESPCFITRNIDDCDCNYVSLDQMCLHLNLKGKFAKDNIRKSYNRYADLNNLQRYTLLKKDPTKKKGRLNSAFVSAMNMFKYLQSRKCKASTRLVKHIQDLLQNKPKTEMETLQLETVPNININSKKEKKATQNQNMMIQSANRLKDLVTCNTDVVIIDIILTLLKKNLNQKMKTINRCQGPECANFNISTEEINIFYNALKTSLVPLLPFKNKDKSYDNDATNMYKHIFGVDATNIHIEKYIFNGVLSLNVQNRNHIQLICCVMKDVFFHYNKILRKFLNLNINKRFWTWAREHKTIQTDAKIRICELKRHNCLHIK